MTTAHNHSLNHNDMNTSISTPEDYILELPPDRQPYFKQLRDTILKHIPKGFEERWAQGMIHYVVPHSLYPDGYHCNPKQPLPFVSIANQKNFIALYHMGMYGSGALSDWFVNEYPNHSKTKLDMGKGCIRFKKADQIPYELIGQLLQKISAKEWIDLYESHLKQSRKK